MAKKKKKKERNIGDGSSPEIDPCELNSRVMFASLSLSFFFQFRWQQTTNWALTLRVFFFKACFNSHTHK